MLRTTLAVALLSCLGQAADFFRPDTLSDTLRVVDAVSVIGYYEEGRTTYHLNEYAFGYGHWYNIYPHVVGDEHATFLFDLSPIPDTALMTAAELGFFQYSDDTAGTPGYNVRAYDYSGADAESLFKAVESAAAISSDYDAHQGWNRVPLTEAGVAALRARLVANTARLAVVEHAWGELGYARGDTAPESLRPYLLVSYLPSAVEEKHENPTTAGLLISPNPASEAVTIRCPSAWSRDAVFRLYDATGSIVYSQTVPHSPFVISTSSFASGVYLARCACGGRTAAARLVVK